MLKMTDIDKIRELKDKNGLSFREISKVTGIDRKTVSKWYNSKDFPEYVRDKQSSPVKDNILPKIKMWIEDDIERIRIGKIHRIRTAKKMFDDLIFMGIQCSESTVRSYVRELKPKEVFIEQEYFPSEDMQVDWGSIDIDFECGRVKVNLFVATLPYSNAKFVYPYMKSDSLSFFDGHLRAFSFFGGIPHRIRYDNLSSAVYKVLKGDKRIEQERMLYFKNFFGIETNYCNVAKGNEKGSVENAVGYVKRMYLSDNKTYKDLDELKLHLENRCKDALGKIHYKKGKTTRELLLEEKSAFKPLPTEIFDHSLKVIGKVSSTLTIQYDGVRYSVPTEYCGKNVVLRVDTENINVYYSDKLIAHHKRGYRPFVKEIYDFRHYLPALKNKSRALPNARCIVRSNFPPIFKKYLNGLNSRMDNGNREMVRILSLSNQYELKDIFFSMEWCYEHNSFSYDAVLIIMKELTISRTPLEKINKVYPEIEDIPQNLQKYDKLLEINI